MVLNKRKLSDIVVISAVLSQHISTLFKESWKVDELMFSLVWQAYHSLKSRFIDVWPFFEFFPKFFFYLLVIGELYC